MYRQLYRWSWQLRPSKSLVIRYTRELEQQQWCGTSELNEISWQRLRHMINHAYENVPFYRQRFRAMGLSPQDIQTEHDLRQLPTTTKDDVREHPDQLIADGYARDKMKRVVTSGSTGVPFVTYHDQDFEAANIAAFARARRWYSWEFGDKVAWVWGRREALPDSLKDKVVHHLKRERWMDGFHPTPERLQAFAQTLANWKPDLIAGYGNVIVLLAQHVLNNPNIVIRPRFVELTAMKMWPHERDLVQEAFQCPVADRYGSHETGSIVVYECPEGNRHIFSDLCHVEVLADGKPVRSGEPGEVVATPLYAFGMPMIRFRVGDIAILGEGQCPCGRGLPLMHDIEGRVTGIFTLPSGRPLYGGAFRHLVLKDSTAIKRFRVHQYARDQIEVTLEKGDGFDDSVVEVVRARCKSLLGDEPVVLTITVTDHIPTTASGKHLVTTSDVPYQLN